MTRIHFHGGSLDQTSVEIGDDWKITEKVRHEPLTKINAVNVRTLRPEPHQIEVYAFDRFREDGDLDYKLTDTHIVDAPSYPRLAAAVRDGRDAPRVEDTPAARSLDVFVIRDLAQQAADKVGADGDGHFDVDLIAGQYVVGVDVHRNRVAWVASQILDDGRLHVVARSME